MKRQIHKLVDYFAYKNPKIWHEIVERIFLYIKEKQKKDMEKTKKNVHKLYNKLMK